METHNEFDSEDIWERVSRQNGAYCDRMKVDGGWLYRTGNPETIAMSFVPDVDLTRYQSHLRDAYKQGYTDGFMDKCNQLSSNGDAQIKPGGDIE